MAKKRASVLSRPDKGRSSTREPVVIPGVCQIGEGPAEDVLVLDLDAGGCRLRGNSLGVVKSQPVQLQIGDLGPIAARLKWVKSGSLGLAFDTPLAADVLENLYETPAPEPNVIPLRRRPAA